MTRAMFCIQAVARGLIVLDVPEGESAESVLEYRTQELFDSMSLDRKYMQFDVFQMETVRDDMPLGHFLQGVPSEGPGITLRDTLGDPT